MQSTKQPAQEMIMNKPVGFGMILLALASCAGMPEDAELSPGTEQEQEPLFLQLNKQADKDLNLITRITLARNHVVEFYEPTPGQIIMSEAAEVPEAPTGRLVDIERLSPSQAYAALTSAAPPAALMAAEHRALERRAEQSLPAAEPDAISVAPAANTTANLAQPSPSATRTQPAGQETTVVRSALSGGYCPSEWFKTQSFKDSGGTTRGFCPNRLFSADYTWCMLDWWGGAYAKSSDTDQTFGTVCADIGSVQMKVSTAGHGGGSWTVPEGTYRWFYSGYTYCGISGNWCDFSARYDITNATNSRFNFGGRFTHSD
jgi:hypothetical protein